MRPINYTFRSLQPKLFAAMFAVVFSIFGANVSDVFAQTEYNARNEFALTQGGTSGVWNYGVSNSATDNTFTQFTENRTDSRCGVNDHQEWFRTGEPFSLPFLGRYTNAGRCENQPSEALFMHPSDSGRRAVLRWTAPAPGTFLLNGVFLGVQPNSQQTTTDAKIIKNAATAGEATLFSGNVFGYNAQQAFNFTVTVAAGDTIDFSVGNGGNSEEFDGTALAVTIGQPVTACQNAAANLQVFVPGENSPSDVQSVNTNASLVGDAFYTNNGKVGRAFNFDGTGDYVRIEDNAVQKPANQLTVEGWFKFNNFNNFPHLVAKPRRGNAFDSYALWYNGGIRIGYQQNGGGFVELNTGFTPQTGIFNHYAFVLNTDDAGTTANTAKLFVNGVEVFSGTAGLPILYDATNVYPLLVGADFESDTPTYFLNGQADEVSIYSRALTQPEIFNLVKQGSFGKCPPANCVQTPNNLVSWFQGEQNALDSRSNNHGTTANAAYTSGRVGQGFDFNGTSNYVAAANDSSLNLTGDVTFDFWMNPTVANQNEVALIEKRNPSNNAATYILFLRNGVFWFAYAPTGSGFVEFNSGVTIPANEFSHIVFTIEGTTAKFYRNGSFVIQLANFGANRPVTTGRLVLGATETSSISGYFQGVLDEVSLYNRALSAMEISAIHAAGQSGKCKPSPLNPPANQKSFFTADGETDNFAGNSAGVLQGNANYAVGKVSQAFNLDGNGDYVEVADNAEHRSTTGEITAECWFRFNAQTDFQHIISKPLAGNVSNSYVIWYAGGELRGGNGNTTAFTQLNSGFNPLPGTWYHVAFTLSGTTSRLFINGSQVATSSSAPALFFDASGSARPLLLGAENEGNNTPVGFVNGRIDEVGIYDRALSQSELAAIYNAQVAGKRKFTIIAGAPPGGSVSYQLTDASVTVPANTSVGELSENGIDLALLPPLPANVTFTGLAYDVSTTATFTGTARVCFNVPALSSGFTFSRLQIRHLENNVWEDRTVTRNAPEICADVSSLSPFAIVQGPAAPTAATANISGRATVGKRGVRNALVTLTEANGTTRTVATGTNGSYRFNDVAAGQNVILTIRSKRFVFVPNTQVINVTEDLDDVNFAAQDGGLSSP